MRPRPSIASFGVFRQIRPSIRPPLRSSTASSIVMRPASSNVPRTSFPMPPDMPREDYAAPAMYTLSYLSRVVRLLVYGALGLGVSALATFEGLHMYIENIYMSTPSRTPAVDDPYAWQEENLGWTGGSKGGTDSRLGWRARHALRGAWICQEWGAGGASSSIGRSVHPEMRGMIGSSRTNTIDRGLELAEEYIDVAIGEAKKRGLVFPDNISTLATDPPETMKAQGDPTAVDLLMLKAGVLERIATVETLRQAKEIYQRLLSASATDTEVDKAKVMRLAGKIGSLASRTGGKGEVWWKWGLQRAGVGLPKVEESKGWFGKRSTSTSSPAVPTLSSPLQRAVLSLLISIEADLATSNQLQSSHAVQQLASSVASAPAASSTPSPSSQLHSTWLKHRTALIQLHQANVLHALRQPASPLVAEAQKAAEEVLTALPTYPASNPLSQPAEQLSKDATALAAEAAYTRGLLLEKTDLEVAVECFERAMTLSPEERGRDWDRYWRGYARARKRMEEALDKAVASKAK